jgi:hypothetical protein
MTLKTFTIEVRADFDDEGKHEILHQAAKEAARTLLTTAMMMQERRKPMVALQSSDFFYGSEELSIHDEDTQ